MSSANFKLKRTAAASRGFLATARFSCYLCNTNIYSSLFSTVVVEKATITDKQDGEKRNNYSVIGFNFKCQLSISWDGFWVSATGRFRRVLMFQNTFDCLSRFRIHGAGLQTPLGGAYDAPQTIYSAGASPSHTTAPRPRSRRQDTTTVLATDWG